MTRRLLRHDASEIRDRRPGVQAGEHVIAARVTRQLVDARVAVVGIAEDDRFGRARLLAGGHQVALPGGWVLGWRPVFGGPGGAAPGTGLFPPPPLPPPGT